MSLLIGCSRSSPRVGDANELTGKLVITGSSTVAPLVGEIAKAFEARHPAVRVDVQSGGSSRGMADVRRGSADIAMVSRALKPGENDLEAHPVALDGIAIIVNRDNPVAALEQQQVVAIYTGRLDNWRSLGGADAPITVVNKAEGRSTLELFIDYFGLANEAIRASVVIGDNQQGIRTVAGDPFAIGYVSIGTAAFEIERGSAIRALPLAGIDANLENVRNGSFPLSRPLNLVTHGPPSALAASFLTFAASAEVRNLVEAQYFVSLSG